MSKPNIFLKSTVRQPIFTIFLLLIMGLISFVFITKSVEYILIQRETEVLGGYYRSIGVLENINDPRSGDLSPGVELVKSSPYFAYGNKPEIVSGVMTEIHNNNSFANTFLLRSGLPEEYWPNTHNTDIWFIGELVEKEEMFQRGNKEGKSLGYVLRFHIDTLLAAYPENAREGSQIVLLFISKGNESAIPIIQEMTSNQRYLIRGWDDMGAISDESMIYGTRFLIKPLDDQQLWYLPVPNEETLDFSSSDLAPIKNKIDILNENIHTLGILATADMSAMPRMQEASNFFYLTEGRWLNYKDTLEGNKVLVMPECLAKERGLALDDEIQLTFRPLKDTYYGHIRDGIDTEQWRGYPTYQDTFMIVGIYNFTMECAYWAYIPSGSLQPGFTSLTQDQFRDEVDYSFVLDSPKNQTLFIQTYKEPFLELGISLKFLESNGPAYWAAVGPIRQSSTLDLQIFSLLLLATLVMMVFLYLLQRKRDHAILRALGVPIVHTKVQLILPLILIGGLGIIAGSLFSWNYALELAKDTLSTIPTPAGVYPSADLNFNYLIGFCLVIFLLLIVISWLGVIILAKKSVIELLQGQTNKQEKSQKLDKSASHAEGNVITTSPQMESSTVLENISKLSAVNLTEMEKRRGSSPAFFGEYIVKHGIRSRLKSLLTLSIALVFLIALGWIQRTLEISQTEIDNLYDTTIIDADIVPADPSAPSYGVKRNTGNGFIYRNTVDIVLNSGLVIDSSLEADARWMEVQRIDTKAKFEGPFAVYAYDSPESFLSSLADPESLTFATGWDINQFGEYRVVEDIKKEEIPILFPANLLEDLALEVGTKIMITDRLTSKYQGVIVGQFAGERIISVNGIKTQLIGAEPILIPLSVLTAMEGENTTFTVVHFSLDPSHNRDLSQVRLEMEEVIKAPAAGTKELRLIIWDEQLRIVINQLENNISLLKILFPVVMTVSILIGAGLSLLLLLQTSKETAILRVLGTALPTVRLTLISEPLALSVIGVILGLGISYLLWASTGVLSLRQLMISAGLYLVGVIIGSVVGAMLVTNKQPIDLLQVKE
ncbi:MAG: hypothetical protein CVU41_07190 [Chloroflexi bacterium HGW-Chloroflexi-3]|nr:MAG: hypothetical protein CVU41_07190 [Chloroflexi bacterium HGW-Chloroflexi-3]